MWVEIIPVACLLTLCLFAQKRKWVEILFGMVFMKWLRMEYLNRRVFLAKSRFMYKNTAYHPTFLLIIGRLSAWFNHILMKHRFDFLGSGLYSTRTHKGPLVLYIGGLFSPNISFAYTSVVKKYIEHLSQGTPRIVFYNPPEALYGQWYEDLKLPTTIEKHAQVLVDSLRHVKVINSPKDLSSIHIIGHSYGSYLTTILRRRYPTKHDMKTTLIDPVPFQFDESLFYNISSNTRNLFFYPVRYPHFFGLALMFQKENQTIGNVGVYGNVRIYIGSLDPLLSKKDVNTETLPCITRMNCFHGFTLFHLPQP